MKHEACGLLIQIIHKHKRLQSSFMKNALHQVRLADDFAAVDVEDFVRRAEVVPVFSMV